ncbi:LysR family transcriptional regulator [Kibdelosporangium aridum]|uniref:LysR family transcriptional regulator n=1 Tax=Kibdelosporangium aridum TaxID=2030 RepID=A0A428ZCB5_KIBAR|nr:LysR family transcriptional regulator [Kibdelosporangium aridum]RSM85724.1 LysR family transcriptional regulator [Kibdelosporangium aridum]
MDAHTRDLRYFVAVAEQLSFTQAAASLFISQPALSKQIRQLELSLHTKLFERDRRTVRLTGQGAALLPHAKLVIEQWEEAQRAVTAARQRASLTVGFQTRIGRGLISKVSARLTEWTLLFRQIPWSDPTVGLGSGDTDVAIAWLPVPGTLAWKVVATEDRWVALPPKHRLARYETVPANELAAEPFIALPGSAGAQREFWLGDTDRHVVAEAWTAEESFEAVASGLGITLLSAGNAEIYHSADIALRPVTGLPPAELAVVWRSDDRRAEISTFVAACEQCLCHAG